MLERKALSAFENGSQLLFAVDAHYNRVSLNSAGDGIDAVAVQKLFPAETVRRRILTQKHLGVSAATYCAPVKPKLLEKFACRGNIAVFAEHDTECDPTRKRLARHACKVGKIGRFPACAAYIPFHKPKANCGAHGLRTCSEQDFFYLIAHSFRRELGSKLGALFNCAERVVFNGKTEPCGKSQSTEHSQCILGKPKFRISDTANAALFNVAHSVKRIGKHTVGRKSNSIH